MGAPIAVGYEDDAKEHHGHYREGDQCFANEVSESPHVKSISYEKGRLHRYAKSKPFAPASQVLRDEVQGHVDDSNGGNHREQEPEEERDECSEDSTACKATFVRGSTHVTYPLLEVKDGEVPALAIVLRLGYLAIRPLPQSLRRESPPRRSRHRS